MSDDDGAVLVVRRRREELIVHARMTAAGVVGKYMPAEKEILVIDDEQMILDMLDQILSTAGYRVVAALGGQQGLELYAQHPVDLVLTDIKMPGVDGYRLLKDIKSRNPAARVVLMSGYSNDFSVREAMELGADEFIVKPFRRNDILQVLASAAEE